jgi:hypothetical protein
MNFDFFNALSKQLGAFGVILGVCIMAIFWLFVIYRRDKDNSTEKLLNEKDKEIELAQEYKNEVTLILNRVDDIKDEILIYLQNRKQV